MARLIPKDLNLSYGTSGATEDELNNVTMNFTVPEGEITAFADAGQNFLSGKLGTTLEFAGSYDPASGKGDAGFFADLILAAQAYDLDPTGTAAAASNPHYTGFAFPTNYSITFPANAPATYTVSVRHNGASAAADGGIPIRAVS